MQRCQYEGCLSRGAYRVSIARVDRELDDLPLISALACVGHLGRIAMLAPGVPVASAAARPARCERCGAELDDAARCPLGPHARPGAIPYRRGFRETVRQKIAAEGALDDRD